jgi:serine/threonine protein kinase
VNWPEIPGYEIQEKLAEGGMGVVYAAVDTTLDRKVAIKMIRPELGTNADGTATEEGVGRFLNEAKAAAKIQSAHVARVLHFGRTDTGELYLILEFLEGSTLGQLLRRESRLKPPRAVKIVRQICRGLKAAHDLGIVHRDLKPANIMLIDQDGDPEFVKILDFGVAKLLGEAESGLTQAGALVGTYTSMAPEQVQGGTIDARTDIYALGVLLFRLLTGQPPFSGTDPALILHHHCFKAPPRLREVVPAEGISPALEAVVLQCLAKDPSQRISSMAELERRLEALASDDSLATDVSAFAAAPTDVSDPTAIASASPISAVDSTVHDEGEDVVFTNIGSGIASGLATVDGSSADAESSGVFQSYSDPPTPMTGAGVTSAAELSGSVNTPDKPEGEVPVSWLRPAAAALTLLVLLLGGALVWLVSGGGEEHETPPVASAPAGRRR